MPQYHDIETNKESPMINESNDVITGHDFNDDMRDEFPWPARRVAAHRPPGMGRAACRRYGPFASCPLCPTPSPA